MGFVQYFLAVLLPAQLVLTLPTKTSEGECGSLCPAGTFRGPSDECKPCAEGFYTSDCNNEDSCHRCFRDCSPKKHLRVVQNCTSKTPLKCTCELGFRCTDEDHSNNCRKCERLQDATAITLVPKQMFAPTSSGQKEPCRSPRCDLQPGPTPYTDPTPTVGYPSAPIAAILSPVVLIGCVALVILFCVHRPRDETCFRQTIAKLCNEEGQDASHKTKDSIHQFPRDSFSTKQQPSPLSAANLGPVHVHNPGTVIFSLLSHFTGQVGPTAPGGKRAERESNEEEDEKDCPVFHPTSSPSIHLSEEERSSETDNIFFPSQEQGKDCHMSKEEEL